MGELKGSEIIAKSLAARGVRCAFTAAGKSLAPVVEALAREEVFEIFTANTETAAAAMADGYARRSRKLAVAITGKKGAALAQVSPITNAWADKIPLLSISLCDDWTPDFSKGIERERFDQGAVFQPVTVRRERAESLGQIAPAIDRCVQSLTGSRKGPAHLDVPASLLERTMDADLFSFSEPAAAAEREIERPRLRADQGAILRAAELIEKARRPLVFAGGGVNSPRASAKVVSFMEKFGIPGATSMAGIGAIPVEHDLCLGGPSYTAGEAFHVAIKEADVVIAVGAGFSGLEGFGLPPVWSGDIRFIHIDMDPLQLGLNVYPEVPLWGDAATALDQIVQALQTRNFESPTNWSRWRKKLLLLKKGRRKRLAWDADHPGEKMHQARMATEIGRLMERENLLTVIDGGNTPLYAAMYAPVTRPLESFFPFGMAALGAGVPYAIGVQLASPDRNVVLVTGDGSFMYNLQELETMKKLGLPIVVFINNDSAWNMIKAMQDSFFAGNYVGTCLPDLDYSRIARGFGLWARRVSNAEEIVPAYEEAKASGGPAVIECVTDNRNLPDSLLSFTMVEFEGSLGDLNKWELVKSMWKMRKNGTHRSRYMISYVVKALLRINPGARWGARS